MSMKKEDIVKREHRRTEIAMWANEQALTSGVVILMGGIVGLFNFSGWQFAGYAVLTGLFIVSFEYPRGIREDGACMRRRGQDVLEPFVSALDQICCNSYWTRSAVYLVLSLPCAGCLPVVIGGVSLLIASLLYFIAAMRNETRKAPEEFKKKKNFKWRKKSTIRQPKHPPPRLIHYKADKSQFQSIDGSKPVKPSIILTVSRDAEEPVASEEVPATDTNNLHKNTANQVNCFIKEESVASEEVPTTDTNSEYMSTANQVNGIINEGFTK